MKRRTRPRFSPGRLLGPALLLAVAGEARAYEVAERSIEELQQAQRSGVADARALTRLYLARIEAVDDAGPRLNAVIEINPEALAEAAARDAERRAGKVRGPLHGIPVLLKDNIDARPMATTAGSLALAGHRPDRDAFLVQRLRRAGAVILGKTNLSEWANFRSDRSTSGWSSAGGQTRNPYALDRNPCGSSSGSAAAVAASLGAVAVGTETDGSIICPAAMNGLVGIKPTVGLVSRHAIVPISPTQDTAGAMARSVADAAVLLSALAGEHAADPATRDALRPRAVDFAAELTRDALRGARIGVMRKSLGFHPDVDAAFERALVALRDAGAEIVDPADLDTHRKWNGPEFELLLYEFRPALESYLAESKAPVRTLQALIEFNQAHAARTMPWFGQELFLQALAKGSLADPAYLSARADARRLARTEGIEATLSRYRLDALVAPAAAPAWVTDPVDGDHFLGAGYGAAAVAGTPSITVPMGDSHGLPVGMVFLGNAWSEARLIGLAYAYEQASRQRRPPNYRATVID
jgi:amidase